MKAIEVVCGIIWKEGKVLIARKRTGKTLATFWEFPGGKLEPGEAAETALRRELLEELGMQVAVCDYFGSRIHHYPEVSIELICYNCNFIAASFKLSDHDEIAFVQPSELFNYKIAPADDFIVEKIAGRKT
jgi:8-oxo-dGTP diphosphatase